MATATSVAIKQAAETERLADALEDIRKRLERIESMCQAALDILEAPDPILDQPVTPKRGRPSLQDK
jgi:hypothetical protein